MRLIQFTNPDGLRRVGVVEGNTVHDLTSVRPDWSRVLDVAAAAITAESSLNSIVGNAIDTAGCVSCEYDAILNPGSSNKSPGICCPIDHPDEHRILISGTGLTHTGGMKSRDQMHSDAPADDEPQTDSARMFQMGIAGGKPDDGARGTAPEWFYKGNGFNLRGPGEPLDIPAFADDGGEEPELAAVYIIDPSGVPRRIGFCLGNEWADHVFEKVNYLYLAPSKLRTCSIGPELITDLPFDSIDLQCTVRRGEDVIYDSEPLLSGEANMCHSLANCEDHHFKFPQHCRPGDVHVHFFGTSKLSFSTRDWTYESGDIVRIESPQMGAALENPIVRQPGSHQPVVARPL